MGRGREDSPVSSRLSRRERSPVRNRSDNVVNVSKSPGKEKPSGRRRRSPSPAREKRSEEKSSRTRYSGRVVKENPGNRSRSMSPENRSPSPRSKRLKRAKAEREAERSNGRQREGDSGDRASRKDRNSDRGASPIDKKYKRHDSDAADNANSKLGRRRSASPSNRHRKSQHRSRSPSAADARARDEMVHTREAEQRNGDNDSLNKMKATEESLEAKDKQKPSFELSGKLAAETNRFRGVTLLFTEPADARKPSIRWRLYVFKAGEVLNEPLYVHRQSCYLFGRERRVADIPTDHPSCSKQHAVLQYRQVEVENPDGDVSKKIKPYLMDLGSTNGTFINDNKMEPQRYYELFEKDTMKFGNSSREYVLLHENSSE